MKYKTHVSITKYIEDNNKYYLVEGIELPNLITDGESFDKAIEMAIDAFSILMTVYEDENNIPKLFDENIKLSLNVFEKSIVEIESIDINEYREKYLTDDKNNIDTLKVSADKLEEIRDSLVTGLSQNIVNKQQLLVDVTLDLSLSDISYICLSNSSTILEAAIKCLGIVIDNIDEAISDIREKESIENNINGEQENG